MPILNELSDAVRRQRIEMGLSQQRLGELAGLSNAIVDQLESGQLTELGVTSAERLAKTLGFGLGVTGTRKPLPERDITDALETAARSGSISYRDTIPSEALRHALLTGEIPQKYAPQLRALLEESPLRKV